MNPPTLPPDELQELIRTELTQKEITEIDMRLLGQVVYNTALTLSRKTNTELLEPISQWLDDPGWMERFAVYEAHTPNWAEYKKRQRDWSEQQKRLFAERMKLYWQEITRKRKFRNELGKILSRPSQRASPQVKAAVDFITPIIAPFSPPEQHKQETQRQFQQALSLAVSDLLPWKLLLQTEITESKSQPQSQSKSQPQSISLNDLKTHYPENPRKDTISKLMHLLQMEMDGTITLNQDQPFGDITIEPNGNITNTETETSITIKDAGGESYNFAWQTLSDAQKNKVIADIKEHRVLCKACVP